MRRLVLVSQKEIPNYANLWGCGLGTDIFTLEQIESMADDVRVKCLTLSPGDGVMLIGGEPFKYLRQFYHYGVRGENYADCAKLRRLSIEGGIFAKCTLDLPEPEEIADFMSLDFTQPVDFSWFKSKCIHTYDDAMKFLDYLDSLPEDTDYGYDYEGSGMPLDKWYELSGVSICTVQFGGFISLTDIRHEVGGAEKDKYREILSYLAYFVSKRQEHIWTYNMQYEYQVSHRMLGGVDLYNLCDASVVNVLDGYHLKKYSLKWTAQRVLQATVWDTEFDRISDLIDSMLFKEEGKLKKDKHKVLKVDKTNFKNTPEWQELMSRYPGYESEFESLMLEYWGNPFLCLPAEILGFYCNLDSFYTLMIYKAKEKEYTPKAFKVFMDNLRLACRLHSCGIPKDEEYRAKYDWYCNEQMAWGITYCAAARCFIKMEKHKKKMANIDKFSPTAIKLLRSGKFHNGDAAGIAKDLLLDHIDTLNSYELGVDEGLLLMDYGPDFAVAFMEKVREAMEETDFIKIYKKTGEKVLKQKIDSSVGGRKKILSVLGEKIKPLLGIDKLKPGDTKLVELEKYLYYERAYNELLSVNANQLNDINNIPSEIYAFGRKFELLEYSDFVSENYFKCKSPIEDVEICSEFADLYKTESAYLTALLESTQQLPGAEKYYDNLGINTIEDGFMHFMGEWKKYAQDGIPALQTAYPEKMYTLAFQYYKNPSHDNVRETWNNFNGYNAQSTLFPYVNDQCEEYEKVFEKEDLKNNFFFMRKFVLNYLRFKKHAKLKSTYVGVDGMFGQTDTLVLEDPKTHIMIREAEPGEPGAIVKMRPHFSCLEKTSKRWASGYHDKIVAFKSNFKVNKIVNL